ncbi:MAG: NUDIX hydrolase [Candidatus Bathyarchaeota archaeon]|nr:NUDIX hydrolase [Candidatus Bathyarchaeum sp.]
MKKWKLVNTKLLCRSDHVSVFDDTVILPSGKTVTFTKIELKDFVSVLPIVEDKVVLIKILRYPRNCLSLEIPSGHIEDGESPKETAFRELEEETGYRAEQLESIGSFNPLSRSTQEAHLFIAKNLKKGAQRLEVTEQIEMKLTPIKDLPKLLTSGIIKHPPTLIALQRFLFMNETGENFSV